MNASGLFNLRTPADLLAKAHHDLERLRKNRINAYAAFDFFVAIRHLPDWLHPNDKGKRDSIFDAYVELRIARHLADGGKHFEATYRHHQQVLGTSATQPAFQSGVFQDAFQVGALTVELDSSDPDTLAIGARVEALSLAERVFAVASTLVA